MPFLHSIPRVSSPPGMKLGYRVIVTCDGKQAFDLFKTSSRPIDLLVTDVVMPSLSGSEAFLQMSALRPNLAVIFMTGYTPEAKILASIVEKGAAMLQKPYTLLALSQLVRTVLDRAPVLHEVMK